MAFVQSDLDTLERAIARGVLRVRYGDHEVVYHSMKEMLEARDLIKRSLKISKGPTHTFAQFTKGTK